MGSHAARVKLERTRKEVTMSAVPVYPVRVEGKLDGHISRWLWLVKWLLVIPHLIVLTVLWIVFVVLSVVAFFSILFTTRYPRSIFDFNLGILRWSWRVAFYSYSALGTDRYPPFSLGEEPDYPATLEVAYPEHLSRGLALVKWWLLAIPHYLIVGIFVSGVYLTWQDGPPSFGLIAVLVLIAGFALLFTERYPKGIFDLVLGLNRWALRVAAYAGLMTDAYPPFRLDMGGSEPAAIAMPPTPTGSGAISTATERRPLGPGAIVASVIASIACLAGLGLALVGGTFVVVDQTSRDSDGYVMSPSDSFTSGSYAITTETVNVPIDGPDELARDLVGNVRIKSESAGPVFIGIARESDVRRYLSAVSHDVIREVGDDTRYSRKGTGRPATPPAEQGFWAASAAGAGSLALDWEVTEGDWVAVAMNEDGSPGVYADVRIGAELDDLGWIGGGLLAAGLVIIVLGGFGIYLALRGARA